MTRRRKISAVLWLCVALACQRATTDDDRDFQGTVQLGDTARTYLLHVPDAISTNAAAPLLLAFHGTGESGRAMQRHVGLDSLADARGLLVAYPDAAVGNWAEGCACSRADLLGVNDTGFVRALVAEVAHRHAVDRGRVYAVGFSQGGLFVQRLACQMADLVTAVASVAAPMSAPVAERCRPVAPVGVLVMHGTLDDAFPYEGERRRERSVLGARETTDLWRLLNGCARDASGSELPDRAADGTRVLEEQWMGCRGGVEVVLYSVAGGRHAWSPSADVRTDALVVDFLLRQRRVVGDAR
ncbi:MAG: hypothetical protein OEW06_09095 [Gemmatimonadota bacterium]|nr:hypothetical protein [Gemmatimonadota bacterium]MDH4351517.1 hypothetical protein [Gemmatimonadota bacterium]